MSKKTGKKLRTRQHIIADLSVNHIERFVTLCGYSVERIEKDYGYDLILFTYDLDESQKGTLESGQVYIQVKATDNLQYRSRSQMYAFNLEKAHIEMWIDEPMPVILAVYDAQRDVAYWLYLQAYFEDQGVAGGENTQVVYLDSLNEVNTQAIELWRKYKSNVLTQLDGVIRHNV